jgi:hypothetical protein
MAKEAYSFRLDKKLVKAVKEKNEVYNSGNWKARSVTDVVTVGLMHYLGTANMNEVFGDKEHAAEVEHEEDNDT